MIDRSKGRMEFLAKEGKFYCSLKGLNEQQKWTFRKKNCPAMKVSSLRSLSKHTLFAQELSDSAIKAYGQVIIHMQNFPGINKFTR